MPAYDVTKKNKTRKHQGMKKQTTSKRKKQSHMLKVCMCHKKSVGKFDF
jgi:hypothetical protein